MAQSNFQFLRRLRETPEFWTERLVSEYTRELARVMDETDVNRNQLADRAGVARSFITRVLSGNANVTTSTMAKLAHALDTKVCVHLAPKAAKVYFMESHDGSTWSALAQADASDRTAVRERSEAVETKQLDIPAWS